jgi:hypothetical protein
MAYIIARASSGAIDLYHGIPNLQGAKVVNIEYDDKDGDLCTTLVFKDIMGKEHKIAIAEG